MRPLQTGDPRQIGPYEIIGWLGAGGMGRVYLGEVGGAKAAVKVIHPELAQDEGSLARFRREIAAAKAVTGRRVAEVIDYDLDGEPPWLATEFVPAESLQTKLERQVLLGFAAAAKLGAQLAEGLAEIHAAGLVHRDIKPGNILMALDGPKLIDFGIARSTVTTPLTKTGQAPGTPQYMAPEQLHGRSPVGPAADVFALGLVIAVTACGEHPFGPADSSGYGYRVVHEEPCLDAVPAGLAGIVLRCLAKDPESRPTPAELIEELGGPSTPDGTWRDRPLLNDGRARPEKNEPAQPSPTTGVDPSKRSTASPSPWVRARRGGVIAGVAGTAILTTMFVLDALNASDRNRHESLPQPDLPTAATTEPGPHTATTTGAVQPHPSHRTPSPKAPPPTARPTPMGSETAKQTTAPTSKTGIPPAELATFGVTAPPCFGAPCRIPLTLKWEAIDRATRYEIRYTNTNGNLTRIYSTTSLSYTINGPVKSDYVCLRMRTANKYGPSAWSKAGCFQL